MKVTERSKVNGSIHCSISTDPRQDSALSRTCWDTVDASEKVSVPNQDIELTAGGQFYLERIIEPTRKKPRWHFDSSLAESLLDCRIEKGIEVCLFMGDTKIGMVSRNAINSQIADTCQRDKEIVKEHISAFVNLFESGKFELVRLFGIDSFSVYDISEEDRIEVVRLVGLDDVVEFFSYC